MATEDCGGVGGEVLLRAAGEPQAAQANRAVRSHVSEPFGCFEIAVGLRDVAPRFRRTGRRIAAMTPPAAGTVGQKGRHTFTTLDWNRRRGRRPRRTSPP